MRICGHVLTMYDKSIKQSLYDNNTLIIPDRV